MSVVSARSLFVSVFGIVGLANTFPASPCISRTEPSLELFKSRRARRQERTGAMFPSKMVMYIGEAAAGKRHGS